MLVCAASDVVLKMKTRQSSVDKTFCTKGNDGGTVNQTDSGGRDGKISTGCDKSIFIGMKNCAFVDSSHSGALLTVEVRGAMSGNHSLCHLLYFP